MLTSDGALNEVICKHCHKREMVRHAGPSSGSKDVKGGEVDDDTTSENSHNEEQIDSDYVDAKETSQTKGKQKTTGMLRPRLEKK